MAPHVAAGLKTTLTLERVMVMSTDSRTLFWCWSERLHVLDPLQDLHTFLFLTFTNRLRLRPSTNPHPLLFSKCCSSTNPHVSLCRRTTSYRPHCALRPALSNTRSLLPIRLLSTLPSLDRLFSMPQIFPFLAGCTATVPPRSSAKRGARALVSPQRAVVPSVRGYPQTTHRQQVIRCSFTPQCPYTEQAAKEIEASGEHGDNSGSNDECRKAQALPSILARNPLF